MVKSLLSCHFVDKDKTKLHADSIKMSAELMKVFINEAIMRSIEQCQAEKATTVLPEHLEKILPQLLMDFT